MKLLATLAVTAAERSTRLVEYRPLLACKICNSRAEIIVLFLARFP
ncbi:MAG: hypothetical protein M3552_05005 [Planctomycetota bacterium]|nr:hypothetical protein [Planctomycetaceae bacterium]MDQ3329998.1 hypothetical protein [Planctomycetota bacterium]